VQFVLRGNKQGRGVQHTALEEEQAANLMSAGECCTREMQSGGGRLRGVRRILHQNAESAHTRRKGRRGRSWALENPAPEQALLIAAKHAAELQQADEQVIDAEVQADRGAN